MLSHTSFDSMYFGKMNAMCLAADDSALERAATASTFTGRGTNGWTACITAGDADLERAAAMSASNTWANAPHSPYCNHIADDELERSAVMNAGPSLTRNPLGQCI